MTAPLGTPSQTVGPFFAIGLTWDEGPRAAREGAVRIHGTVFDGAGEPIPDALVETWQTEPRQAGFRGFARCPTDDEGRFEIFTLKPGPVPPQAPHIDLSVFARGLLNRCVTRIYFADEPQANAEDPVLATVPDDRRETLLAQPDADGNGYRLDIHLQGPAETVFFSL